MLLKWIQNRITGVLNTGADSDAVARGKTSANEPMDVAHEAMRNDAVLLNTIARAGQHKVDRQKMKDRIRKKVKGSIAKTFDDDDVVEEVTERILDAAEFDPLYRDMFKDEG